MSSTLTARLFVAVELPHHVRGELARWARGALYSARCDGRQPRLLDAESLHLTVLFIGSQPASEIDAIAQALMSIEEPLTVGELELGAPLWLPTRRPRALAVEVHDDERRSLKEIHDAITGALLAESQSHRALRPHVTVARMGRGRGPRQRALPPTPPIKFQPRSATLFRSWLSPAGATYQPLHDLPLYRR